MLDKTVAVTAERIAATGGRLISEARCAHEVAPLAERLGRAGAIPCRSPGPRRSPTGATCCRRRSRRRAAWSSTSACRSIPAICCCSPISRPVLGLPGCARSPKLNGFDWVLERLAAGIPVTRQDIMGMGGGLLTEIPSRPQPREAKPRNPARSQRWCWPPDSPAHGPGEQAAGAVDGRPMVAHAVDAMLASRADPVIVVTGHQAEAVRAALGERPVILAHNPDYALGLSSSLAAGLAALPEDAEGVVIGLGDMPRITAAQIDRLIAAFNPLEDARSACRRCGKRGNPVLFATRFVPEMRAIGGDVGARHLIGEHAEEVVEIELDDDGRCSTSIPPEALAALIGTDA